MAGAALAVNSDQFDSMVLQSNKVVFVDFWATWCPPCRAIAPAVEELAKDYEGRALVVKIDLDESGDIASDYGVMAIPTLMVFKNGQAVETVTGAISKQKMAMMIDKHL